MMDYDPVFKELQPGESVIKPAIKEINDLTDYHVEVEQKRIGTAGSVNSNSVSPASNRYPSKNRSSLI